MENNAISWTPIIVALISSVGYGKKFGEVATSLVSMAKDIEFLKSK